MRAALLRLARDRIEHEPVILDGADLRRNGDGQPVRGDAQMIRCKFERGNRVVRDREGNLVPSIARAFLVPTPVHAEDLFRFEGAELHPIAVKEIQDPVTGRPHHVEVSF